MQEWRARRVAVWVGLGMFLIQTAWILALPPYRGLDEFDHVYRANSVAQGYWRTWETPQDGRGELIPVRRSLVEDGTEVCRSYEYTGPDNCRPVEALGGGNVTVASAAARYNPVPYIVLGLPSLVAEGSAGVYAMRWFNAGLCALLVGWAAWIASLFRTVWPLAGLVLCLSPVMIYSTAVVAPNGFEMTAALAVWLAVSALPVHGARPALLLVLTVSAIIVAGARPLGPLWIFLILALATLGTGARPLWRALSARPRLSCGVIALLALSVMANTLWLLASRTYEIPPLDLSHLNRWTTALGEVPLWILQSIAAFPARNEPAPTIVYLLVLFPFSAFVVFAWVKSFARTRVALAVTAITAVAVPFAFTVATVQQHGTVWQGRYGLPLSVGLVLLAALGVERSSIHFRRGVLIISFASIGAAHTISVLSVLLREIETSPLAGDARWVMLPATLVAALAGLGTAVMVLPILTRSSLTPEEPRRLDPKERSHASKS